MGRVDGVELVYTWSVNTKSLDTISHTFFSIVHLLFTGRRYKYVHFAALPPLFFDLQEDPGEFVNQANNPDYQSIMLEYAQKMLSWRMRHTHRGLTEIFLTEEGPVTRHSPAQQVA